MGKEQLEALIRVLQEQLQRGADGVVVGTWTIRFDKEQNAFAFEKCEFEDYCMERPSVIALDGAVIDAGGPIFQPAAGN